MTWQWHRNVDGVRILRDEVTICNTAKGMYASCRKRPGMGSKPNKMNPAKGAKWRRRVVSSSKTAEAERVQIA